MVYEVLDRNGILLKVFDTWDEALAYRREWLGHSWYIREAYVKRP